MELTSPSFIKIMMSLFFIVDNLCATINFIPSNCSKFLYIIDSVSASRLLVASSNKRILGSDNKALASNNLFFCLRKN